MKKLEILFLHLFVFCLLTPVLSTAQWFEGYLYMPDSFSGTCGTSRMVWNSIDDKIYLIGFN